MERPGGECIQDRKSVIEIVRYIGFGISTISEVFGTKPDVELEASSYPTAYPLSGETDALLKDPWIGWGKKEK